MPQDIAHQLWFKAEQFQIEPGEDEQTNPLCFGKALATWLRGKLTSEGHTVEEVIAEDWGWCVMCQRVPFMLWIGCANVHDYSKSGPEHPPPRGGEVVWSCMVVAELPLLSRLFKRPDTGAATEKLFEQVRRLLNAEPDVTFVEQP
jgi:hypothetical protein